MKEMWKRETREEMEALQKTNHRGGNRTAEAKERVGAASWM